MHSWHSSIDVSYVGESISGMRPYTKVLCSWPGFKLIRFYGVRTVPHALVCLGWHTFGEH